MDFGTLLSVAQKNEQKQERKACYQTKFAPPKKETKQSKVLSNNIKKFLAKKEEEERKKAEEEKKKKENLLALRDHKAQSRINKHLKVCKAANKSVLADAVDNDNTAVTIAGPSQCDEDDYGYVSQEASAFYNKLMNKYSSLPPEKPLFSDDGKKTVKDIASTKDRVKQALKQQEIEDSLPHKRKRKHKETESDTKNSKHDNRDDHQDNDSQSDKEIEPEKEEKPRPKKRPMPPPMDFTELLKLAEKKQYEPIKIEPKPKPKDEPERLMTKKQMKEYAKEKEWRERKEQRNRNPELIRPGQSSVDNSKFSKSDITKSSKLNSGKSLSDINSEKTVIKSLPSINKKPLDKSMEKNNMLTDRSKYPCKPFDRCNGINKPLDRSNNLNKQSAKPNVTNRTVERSNITNRPMEKCNTSRSIDKHISVNKNSSSKVSEKDAIAEERKKLEEEKRKLEEMRRSIEEERRKLLMSKGKSTSTYQNSVASKIKEPIKSIQSTSSLTKKVPSKQNSTNEIKSRPFPPADVKPRQFPPPDVRSSKPKSTSSKLKVHKRRIYDEDDEEYDSELDDFIDDGSEGEGEDYSKYISEIFGYDKSKYRHVEDDDIAMESNFAQQLKEEFHSTKIGIMEDLEDIRQEALEKKKKASMKNKSKL